MESEAALASTLSKDFKSMMTNDKSNKLGNNNRKNSRQQMQQQQHQIQIKKAPMRNCASLPCEMASLTTTKASSRDNETATGHSPPILENELPKIIEITPSATSYNQILNNPTSCTNSNPPIMTKAASSAISKKENEIKLKYVVEKIKSKLNNSMTINNKQQTSIDQSSSSNMIDSVNSASTASIIKDKINDPFTQFNCSSVQTGIKIDQNQTVNSVANELHSQQIVSNANNHSLASLNKKNSYIAKGSSNYE